MSLPAIAGIIFALALTANAQDKPTRYLFQNNNDLSVTGFGGPLVIFSSMPDGFSVSSGGGGAALFNQQFFIGGYGEGLATEHFVRDLSIYYPSSQTNHYYEKLQLSFGHGGLWLGYIHDYHKLLHWGVSAKLGAGGIGLSYPGFNIDKHYMLTSDVVFVFLPQAEMEINLFPWMKLNLGLAYRLVSGVNNTYEFSQPNGSLINKPYFNSSDFNSPSFTLGLLFGGFTKKNQQ